MQNEVKVMSRGMAGGGTCLDVALVQPSHADPPVLGHVHVRKLGQVGDLLRRHCRVRLLGLFLERRTACASGPVSHHCCNP